MKLSLRLEKIANMITKDAKVADIGTDHGYIPVYLVENNISKSIIASDINKKPLKKAIDIVKSYKLNEFIELRLGSGLEVLDENESDEIIIAGMGGILIKDLLEASKNIVKNAKSLILQPMQAQKELRKYLIEKNYEILEEVLIREDQRIYEIIKVRFDSNKKIYENIDDIDFECGIKFKKDELYKEFLQKKIDEYENIKLKLKDLDNEKIKEKYELCNKKINLIGGKLSEIS